jgi:hypothetical protein
MINNSDYEICLLVLARKLADELRPINYADEWSRKPLIGILQPLCNALNLHSEQLGTILNKAFTQTFPTPKPGNINQLALNHPSYFDKTRQYFLDMFFVEEFVKNTAVSNIDLSGDLQGLATNKAKRVLASLAMSILNAFTELTQADKNQHRTLAHICYALTPVYYSYGMIGIGFDLTEYADQWQNLNAVDRVKLRNDIEEMWS